MESRYLPLYSTTRTISKPDSWSVPQVLTAKDEAPKWIDFWVICDDQTAYLFYSRGNKDVFVKTTRLKDFPKGFGPGRLAFAVVPEPPSEATHIYKAKGRQEYHLFFETHGQGLRRYGLATAHSLRGPWTRMPYNYASGPMLRWPIGAARWTEGVSHGEMLRSGVDQRLEYDYSRPEFLIQGVLKSTNRPTTNYTVPWKLGVIKGQFTTAPRAIAS